MAQKEGTKLIPAVSNKGRYRSYTGIISYGTQKAKGTFCINVDGYGYEMSRMVLAAFKGAPSSPAMVASYLDGSIGNNVIENLDWRTHQQVKIATVARQDPSTKKRTSMCKAIRFRRRDTTEWRTFHAVADLATFLGLSNGGSLSSIANDKRTHSEYECEFVEVCMLENELWQKAPDVDIFVSTMGRVQNSRTGVVTNGVNLDGYRAVFFQSGTILVHDLVMRTFVGPRPEGMVIDHLDGNKEENKLTNLEYVTSGVNNQRAIDQLQRKSSAPARSHAVIATNNKDGTDTTFESKSEAARHFETVAGTIGYAIQTGRVGTQGRLEGYSFRMDREPSLLEGEEWRDITPEIKAIARIQLKPKEERGGKRKANGS